MNIFLMNHRRLLKLGIIAIQAIFNICPEPAYPRGTKNIFVREARGDQIGRLIAIWASF